MKYHDRLCFCVTYILVVEVHEATDVSLHFSSPVVNCLDRHMHTCPERVALIWERDEPGSEVKVTYRSASCFTRMCGFVL